MGLNRPVLEQYFSWVTHAAQGDFGKSFLNGQSVTTLVLQRLPTTLQLASLAIVIGMVIAFPLGIISAMKPNSLVDVVASVVEPDWGGRA